MPEETKESEKEQAIILKRIGEGFMFLVALAIIFLFCYLIIFRTEEILSAPIFPEAFSKIQLPSHILLDYLAIICVVMLVFSLLLQNSNFTSIFSTCFLLLYIIKNKEETISSLQKLKDDAMSIRFSFQSIVIILLLIIIFLLILILLRRRYND